MSTNKENAKAIHNCFQCDICNCQPIEGTRYKCIICPDYDECENCHKTSKHEHLMKAIKTPIPNLSVNNNQNLVHKNHTCSLCKQSPIIGVMYQSTIKPNYDLCRNCYQLDDHDINHTFNLIDFSDSLFPNHWKKCNSLSEYKYLMVAKPLVESKEKCDFYSVPLKNINLNVFINNSNSKTELVQEFINDSNEMLEVEYVFPISTDACFDSFTVEYKNNIIKGIVKEKEQAKSEYKQHLAAGHAVAYSEINKASPDCMKILIGNVPAQTPIKIKYCYIEELEISCNQFYKYSIPATITPRYYNSTGKHLKDQIDLANVSTLNPESEEAYTWSISLSIQSPSKITFYKSPSHKLEVIEENPDENSIKLKVLESLQSQYMKPNETFNFLYTNENIAKPQVIMSQNDKLQQKCAQITFIPNFSNASFDDAIKQQYETSEGFHPDIDLSHAQAEFIFVLDRSGSMSGSRIQKAKEALQLFLSSLPPDCYFNICSFGSGYSYMFPNSQKYDEQILEKAINEVKTYSADYGGTEIYQPLQGIFNQPVNKTYPKNIFLLTDGCVSNEYDTLNLISSNNSTTKVHTIGIGSGCSENLIKEGAKCGKGNYIFISDNENVQAKIIQLLDDSLTPFINNFSFEYDKNLIDTIIPAPSSIDFLQLNQQFKMYIYFKEGLETFNTTFSLKCFDSTLQQYTNYPLELNSNSSNSFNDLFKLGIHKQIKILERHLKCNTTDKIHNDIYYQRKFDLKQEIISLSLNHQIVSTLTSFLCIIDQSDEQNQQWKSKNTNTVIVPQLVSIDYSKPQQQNKQRIGKKQKLVCSDSEDESEDFYCDDYEPEEEEDIEEEQKQNYFEENDFELCDLQEEQEQLCNKFVFQSIEQEECTIDIHLPISKKEKKEKKKKNKKTGGKKDEEDFLKVPQQPQQPQQYQQQQQQQQQPQSQRRSSRTQKEKEIKQTVENISKPIIQIPSATFLQVLNQVKPMGYWQQTTELLGILKVSEDQLLNTLTQQDKNTLNNQVQTFLITIAIYGWLEKYFLDKKQEWKLIEKKMLSWIKNLQIQNWNEIKNQISQLL